MIASSNLFNSTQAVAPVGNNTKKHTITVAQFWEKNLKPLKSLQTRRKKRQNKTKQKNWMEKNKQALFGFSYIYLAFKTTETSKNI